ncbi:MAG TPA: aromatic ring-hydroxylating dioxygenase subunit alpha [Thermoleophilaceae bacterium]|jgi:Rieske 2Fe-2S family protein
MEVLSTSVAPAFATAAGEALEPKLYLDPAVAEREQRRIFERHWQLAGHVAQLPNPGSYITSWAGNQPVLVVRSEEGELRAFRNVCRHRGSMLLTGSGQCKAAIRCRYHGWTYRLDGELIGVPEGRAFGEKLDKSALGLMPARVEEMCGLLFVNLDENAPSLADTLGDLPQRLAPYRIEQLEHFSPYRGSQPANWKVIIDNYLEGYHVPIAHPGLMRLLDYKNYTVELHDNYVWFDAPLREDPTGNRMARLYSRIAKPMAHLDEEHHRIWRYVFIYPNTTLDLYPDQVDTWQIRPNGVSEVHDSYDCYRPANSSLRTRVTQRVNHRFNTEVLDEDIDLVKNVQRGLATRDYSCGPLSAREAAVGWFADRVRRDLA